MNLNISKLTEVVINAGKKARDGQAGVAHTIKSDGSALTQFDTEINHELCNFIIKEFPTANLISEEENSTFCSKAPYTFTVDPIDGTDSFIQGYPGWAVAVGILDQKMAPTGAIIYCPRWATPTSNETLIILEPGEEPIINGKSLKVREPVNSGYEYQQIMTSSTLHKKYSIEDFKGRTRYAGCAVLNILSTILYPNVSAACITPLHIWDIAAPHAILKKLGYKMEYLSKKQLFYKNIVNREHTEDLLIAGKKDSIQQVQHLIRRL